MKKILFASFWCMTLLISGQSTGGVIGETPAEKTKQNDFYAWPIEKRINDLDERKKRISSLNDEEKALLDRQTYETILQTIHDTFGEGLGTIHGLASSIAPNIKLTKAPIENLADFVYLFDNVTKEICDKDGAYKKNIAKLYWVTRCMTTKPSAKKNKKNAKICVTYECTSPNKCLAVALNCTVIALKPFAKMFVESTDINGQHIDNGLVIMAKIIEPVILADSNEKPKFVQDMQKLGALLKFTITFFIKTRDMLIEGENNKEIITIQSGSLRPDLPGAITSSPTKMAPELYRAQLVFNNIGSLANMTDAFAKNLGTGFVGNMANSLLYSVINVANMGTDIVTLASTNALEKITKQIECLLKNKKALIREAAAYSGAPGDNMSCPSLGCIDLKTCHAMTMLGLTTIIKPFVENFVGKVQLDSSGNPTNKIEMGLFMNITNALSEVLSLFVTQKDQGSAKKIHSYQKALKTLRAQLEKMQTLTDKSRDIQIMFAGAFARLIPAFERTAFGINPDIAKYTPIRVAQEKISEETPESIEVPTNEEFNFNADTIKNDVEAMKAEIKGVENE